MENQMTVGQVLTETIKLLGNINVPGEKIQEIGIPLMQSIENLKLCVSALETAEKEAKEKAEAEAKEPNTLFEGLDGGEEDGKQTDPE